DGRVGVSGARDRGMTLADLARTVHFRSNELEGLEPSLEATVHFTNAQPGTFTNGAHLAVVEVDVETGRVSVLRYVAVDDCGRGDPQRRQRCAGAVRRRRDRSADHRRARRARDSCGPPPRGLMAVHWRTHTPEVSRWP